MQSGRIFELTGDLVTNNERNMARHNLSHSTYLKQFLYSRGSMKICRFEDFQKRAIEKSQNLSSSLWELERPLPFQHVRFTTSNWQTGGPAIGKFLLEIEE